MKRKCKHYESQTDQVGGRKRENHNGRLVLDLWFLRQDESRNEVGIHIENRLINDLVKVQRKGVRILRLIIVCDTKFVVISAFASQVHVEEALGAPNRKTYLLVKILMDVRARKM